MSRRDGGHSDYRRRAGDAICFNPHSPGAGHTVREAQDGREAIDEFRRKRPALIISDILMPNVEGIETISTLRREEPSIPIIAISGGVVPLYLRAAAKLGATASLEKPFSVDALRLLVEKLLADCHVDSS